jgi:succinyl-CoA synthetase beta subunit
MLVEEAIDLDREIYMSILLDRATASPLILASAEGGMEIEELAAKSPEKILRERIDPRTGLMPYQGRKLAFGMGLRGDLVKQMVKMVDGLYRTFRDTDASLVEINPMVVTKAGQLLALDAKISFDDNGLFRHQELRELRDLDEEDPLEVEASKHGLSYIRLDGNVGCMVNGAGLAMATMDIIKAEGGEPANFLDVGGGASSEEVAQGFKILLSDPNVRTILINIFGGIVRCDRVASGVVEAVGNVGVNCPIVVRLQGTNADEGRSILERSGLNFSVAKGMQDAARKAVQLARSAGGSSSAKEEVRS